MADDEVAGETFGRGACASHEFQHAVHRGGAEAELGLADGGERDAEVFADEDVPETDEGKVIGNLQSLAEENVRRADGD